MFFRNVTFFRFPASLADATRTMAADGELQQELAASPARPCGALEMSARGWASPYSADSTALFQQSGDCILLSLGGEDKILPASVVNDQLSKRLAELEQREGRRLGGRARKRLKEDLVHELLPRALCKPYRLAGYLDLQECFLAVDTSSRKAAEEFVSQLRHALGSFPALPLNAEVAPRVLLTEWVAHGPAWSKLYLADSATLEAATSDGGKVTMSGLELDRDEIQIHLDSGMKCSRLGLTLDDRLSFTFGEDLIVRKLKFLDAALESLDGDREDLRAELDARFALLSGEVRHLFRTLAGPFKFSAAEG